MSATESYKAGDIARLLDPTAPVEHVVETPEPVLGLSSVAANSDSDSDSDNEGDHSDNEDENKGDADAESEQRRKRRKLSKKAQKDIEVAEQFAEQVKLQQKQAERQRQDDRNERTCFVSNVPAAKMGLDATRKTLMKLFKSCGKVEAVRFRSAGTRNPLMPRKAAVLTGDFHEQRDTMNAYVVMATVEAAQKAVSELNGSLCGESHHLSVDMANRDAASDQKFALFCGNLPLNVRDEELRVLFANVEGVGHRGIRSVRCVRDANIGIGKGFGYVNFVTREALEKALAEARKSPANFKIANREVRVRQWQSTQVLKKAADNKSKQKKKNAEQREAKKQRRREKEQKKHGRVHLPDKKSGKVQENDSVESKDKKKKKARWRNLSEEEQNERRQQQQLRLAEESTTKGKKKKGTKKGKSTIVKKDGKTKKIGKFGDKSRRPKGMRKSNKSRKRADDSSVSGASHSEPKKQQSAGPADASLQQRLRGKLKRSRRQISRAE
ncbi:MAG: hypothetical protein MHM6MM_003571 [Cercozoa sp. M6MM]